MLINILPYLLTIYFFTCVALSLTYKLNFTPPQMGSSSLIRKKWKTVYHKYHISHKFEPHIVFKCSHSHIQTGKRNK